MGSHNKEKDDRQIMSPTINNNVFLKEEDTRKKRMLRTGYTTGTSASAPTKASINRIDN